ncbi:MAG: carbonic anhydrase [Planctomycetes bacterium]|nr:carbonic anhydrase [Planctomycetota bacterium]
MLEAQQALARLREGNARFTSGLRSLEALLGPSGRDDLASGQEPFAIVLGCSDSRVPAEMVFDQGLGTLFVIRVAGNVVAPSQVGSVEFAAARFGTRLVVVLGHTRCGAIDAAVEDVLHPGEPESRNIRSIVDRVRPAVEGVLDAGGTHDEIARRAGRANVRASVDHLRHGSTLLEDLILSERLLVVGAEYDLRTGVVDFFEG